MKRILITNLIILLILGINNQTFAQKDKKQKDKTVKLKYERIENGKKVVTDTTFTLKKDEDLDKVLEKYGVKNGKQGAFTFKIQSDDSLKNEQKQMVWVNVGDNGDTKEIHISKNGKDKQVIITDDADIELIGDEELTEITVNHGDSVKTIKKIIHTKKGTGDNDSALIIEQGNVKTPKHKKIKKVYKFDNGNMRIPHHQAMFLGDLESEINKVIIKELNEDSMEVFISKIMGDDFVTHFDMPIEHNFEWYMDEDFVVPHGSLKHMNAKYKLEDLNDEDLKQLKLEKNYKKLDLDEFMIVFNGFGGSMDLSFISKEKGDISLNIYDDKGNSSVVIELKDFKSKFEKEIDLPMGSQILKITQNNKHFIKKLSLDKENK
jgi:hypothetical protein